MIVVVLILVILILSVILAFQFGRKSVPTPVSAAKIPNEAKQGALPPVTEKAQSIETVPPENKGTCETTGDWAMSGECEVTGTAIYTQTYKESKPGACPSTEKARVKPCCYQKGDWADISECKATGFKTQQQTTVNCADNIKMREYTCEYVGPWTKVGACTSDGNQAYYRVNVNSIKPTTKTEKCCYLTSDW